MWPGSGVASACCSMWCMRQRQSKYDSFLVGQMLRIKICVLPSHFLPFLWASLLMACCNVLQFVSWSMEKATHFVTKGIDIGISQPPCLQTMEKQSAAPMNPTMRKKALKASQPHTSGLPLKLPLNWWKMPGSVLFSGGRNGWDNGPSNCVLLRTTGWW